MGDFVATAFAVDGISDWQSHVEIDARFLRAADPGEQRGDASKASRELGWQPEVSFDQMVADMVAEDLAALDRPSKRWPPTGSFTHRPH